MNLPRSMSLTLPQKLCCRMALLETGLVEIQEWLVANGLSCKRKLPETDEYMRGSKSHYIIGCLRIGCLSA